MKTENMILIAGGLIAAFIIFRAVRKGGGGSSANPLPSAADYSSGVNAWSPWNLSADGSAVAPNGDHYSMGSLIWKAAQS